MANLMFWRKKSTATERRDDSPLQDHGAEPEPTVWAAPADAPASHSRTLGWNLDPDSDSDSESDNSSIRSLPSDSPASKSKRRQPVPETEPELWVLVDGMMARAYAACRDCKTAKAALKRLQTENDDLTSEKTNLVTLVNKLELLAKTASDQFLVDKYLPEAGEECHESESGGAVSVAEAAGWARKLLAGEVYRMDERLVDVYYRLEKIPAEIKLEEGRLVSAFRLRTDVNREIDDLVMGFFERQRAELLRVAGGEEGDGGEKVAE